MSNIPLNAPYSDPGSPEPSTARNGARARESQDQDGRALAGKPKPAVLLRNLAILSLVLTLIGWGLGVMQTPNEAVDTQMNAAGTVSSGTIMLVANVALYALVIVGLSRNENWARIVGAVCAIVALFALIGSIALSLYLGAPLLGPGALGLIAALLAVLKSAVDVWFVVLALSRRAADQFKHHR